MWLEKVVIGRAYRITYVGKGKYQVFKFSSFSSDISTTRASVSSGLMKHEAPVVDMTS